MARISRHHFALHGAAEVDIIVARPEEWAGMSQAHDPAWSVSLGRTIVACRLVISGVPLDLPAGGSRAEGTDGDPALADDTLTDGG